MPAAFELLVAIATDWVASKNAVSVVEELVVGATVVEACGWTVCVERTVVTEDEDVFSAEVEVLETASVPPVIVTSWPPKSEPPFVNVVVAAVAADVIVPRLAWMVLLHTPWSDVMVQPTSTLPEGSVSAVGACV